LFIQICDNVNWEENLLFGCSQRSALRRHKSVNSITGPMSMPIFLSDNDTTEKHITPATNDKIWP
jgi:hypothetical protein